MAAVDGRRLRGCARGADRWSGGADGAGRVAGDLPVRLAGGCRCERGRRDVSGSELVSGGFGAEAGSAVERCAAARGSDRLVGGAERDRLAGADRGGCGGGLRRRIECVRVDAGDDRGRRGGGAFRGSAGGGEEVRPPGREGAGADVAVRADADCGAAGGGRAERADGAGCPDGRAQRDATDERCRRARCAVRDG